MTKEYSPIPATAIGDGFTTQEERWNESELKEVEKIKEKIQPTLNPFRKGEILRDLVLQNLNEDFTLTWDEKAELLALEAKQLFNKTVLLQGVRGKDLINRRL
ncbi:MAG: hypothetical protein KJ950_07700 [Proteobacteria bacterium]|nr:hypothetical protein [Pseudomonadota bacterium]MBU1687241.1 hypothetical protein [Pseudomonadota bacterium]